MAEGVRLLPTLVWLPEQQEQALVDTGVRLERRGGFTLGGIEGAERLCLLCPEYRITTAVVSAWAWCGHCDDPLTWLASSQQEPQFYNMDLHSGLCRLQPRKSQEGRRGPGIIPKRRCRVCDSPAKREDIGKEESVMACSLAVDLETVSTANAGIR